jgi:hypothetical protein
MRETAGGKSAKPEINGKAAWIRPYTLADPARPAIPTYPHGIAGAAQYVLFLFFWEEPFAERSTH